MTIKTITAGHSRKEGRPNYGSEDYHFSLTIEVEPGFYYSLSFSLYGWHTHS